MKRIIGGVVIAVLAVGAGAAALSYEPPVTDCTVLLDQAEHTSDAGTLLEEAGCVEPSATPGQDLTAQP